MTARRTVVSVLVLLVATILLVCTHLGPQESELGRVEQTVFLPGQSGEVTTFSTAGHVGFGSVNMKPTYAVVFSCEHGRTFSINDKSVWQRLKQGDSVTIYFNKVLNIKGEVVEYRFINAVKWQ